MYQKIKRFVFTALFLLLWARFILLIGDPTAAVIPVSSGEAYPIYSDWREAIEWVYRITGYIVTPLYNIYYATLGNMIPTNPWFPVIDTATLRELINTNESLQTLRNDNLMRALRGSIAWMPLIAMVILQIIDSTMDKVIDFLKNLIWNVLIEFSFTKKKQKVYQEKLEERAADLLKMKIEYRNLSKEANQLAETVIKDELTGLYNKRFFIQRVTDEFNEAKSGQTIFSIVMVDIDHFKKLNDTYGHLMGDKVLKEVAKVLLKGAPKGTYPCRFGGEEFSIIMPGKGPEDAYRIAEAIHTAIPALRYEEDPELVVTISMGLLTVNFAKPEAQELTGFEDAIELADQELYRAKLDGRNCIKHKTIL